MNNVPVSESIAHNVATRRDVAVGSTQFAQDAGVDVLTRFVDQYDARITGGDAPNVIPTIADSQPPQVDEAESVIEGSPESERTFDEEIAYLREKLLEHIVAEIRNGVIDIRTAQEVLASLSEETTQEPDATRRSDRETALSWIKKVIEEEAQRVAGYASSSVEFPPEQVWIDVLTASAQGELARSLRDHPIQGPFTMGDVLPLLNERLLQLSVGPLQSLPTPDNVSAPIDTKDLARYQAGLEGQPVSPESISRLTTEMITSFYKANISRLVRGERVPIYPTKDLSLLQFGFPQLPNELTEAIDPDKIGDLFAIQAQKLGARDLEPLQRLYQRFVAGLAQPGNSREHYVGRYAPEYQYIEDIKSIITQTDTDIQPQSHIPGFTPRGGYLLGRAVRDMSDYLNIGTPGVSTATEDKVKANLADSIISLGKEGGLTVEEVIGLLKTTLKEELSDEQVRGISALVTDPVISDELYGRAGQLLERQYDSGHHNVDPIFLSGLPDPTSTEAVVSRILLPKLSDKAVMLAIGQTRTDRNILDFLDSRYELRTQLSKSSRDKVYTLLNNRLEAYNTPEAAFRVAAIVLTDTNITSEEAVDLIDKIVTARKLGAVEVLNLQNALITTASMTSQLTGASPYPVHDVMSLALKRTGYTPKYDWSLPKLVHRISEGANTIYTLTDNPESTDALKSLRDMVEETYGEYAVSKASEFDLFYDTPLDLNSGVEYDGSDDMHYLGSEFEAEAQRSDWFSDDELARLSSFVVTTNMLHEYAKYGSEDHGIFGTMYDLSEGGVTERKDYLHHASLGRALDNLPTIDGLASHYKDLQFELRSLKDDILPHPVKERRLLDEMTLIRGQVWGEIRYLLDVRGVDLYIDERGVFTVTESDPEDEPGNISDLYSHHMDVPTIVERALRVLRYYHSDAIDRSTLPEDLISIGKLVQVPENVLTAEGVKLPFTQLLTPYEQLNSDDLRFLAQYLAGLADLFGIAGTDIQGTLYRTGQISSRGRERFASTRELMTDFTRHRTHLLTTMKSIIAKHIGKAPKWSP